MRCRSLGCRSPGQAGHGDAGHGEIRSLEVGSLGRRLIYGEAGQGIGLWLEQVMEKKVMLERVMGEQVIN